MAKKILIIEDDFFIRDLYELQAKKSGYTTIAATDGEEGIIKAKSESPDLILIDLMLPKIDGLTVLKTLKKDPATTNIPCIIITNFEGANKDKEAKDAGAVEYLLKIKNTPEKVIQIASQYLK